MAIAGESAVPVIDQGIPTSARTYGWMLGGTDNYEVDRQFVRDTLRGFPECVDIARHNREFLYRAVRYLVEEAGIVQFLDLGCGLPADDNVHQIAQRSTPSARVVYVDIDPSVPVHGQALLADDGTTTVVTADMRDQDAVLGHPEVNRLIDIGRPVAVLLLSGGHHLLDADAPRRVVHTVMDRAVPGSHLGFSQVVTDDPARGAALSEQITAAGIPWQTRTPGEVDALFTGLIPVSPGLVNLAAWRPDPDQPELAPVPAELAQYAGAGDRERGLYEYGGLLLKP